MDDDAGSAAGDDDRSESTVADSDSGADDELDPWDSTIVAPNVESASEGDAESTDDPNAEPTDEPEASVAGTFAPDVPIEPEVVDPTNAAFVVLGAYLGIMAIAAFLAPQGGLTVWNVGWLTLGFLAVAGLAYAFFARSNPATATERS